MGTAVHHRLLRATVGELMTETPPSFPADHDARADKWQIGSRWFVVVGPPLVAFGQQQVAYGLVDSACASNAVFILFIPAMIALVIVAFAALLSWRAWNHPRERSTGGPTPVSSTRFFALLGFLMCGMSAAVIVAQSLPQVFLHPCQG